MPRILALDPSTRVIGWCAADGGDFTQSGELRVAGDTALQRLAAARAAMFHLIFLWQPRVLAVEEPISSRQLRNYRTDRLLSMLTGIAYGLALGWGEESGTGCEFLLVNPRSVIATGCHKRARRRAAAVAGKEVGGDEADAIGVWLAAWSVLRERQWLDQATEP